MFKLTLIPRALCFACLVGGSPLLGTTFNTVTVNQDATIAGAAFFGSVSNDNTPLGPITPFPGMKVHVTQGSNEVWNSVMVSGYYQDNWVTVEQWGNVPSNTGRWEPQYTWGIVSEEYIPPVYDYDGSVITEGYWNQTFGDVYTGDVWVADPDVWGITGTITENQPIWVPDHYESTYSYTQFHAPLIHQTATRSDANWVWEVPTSEGTTRAVMRLWDGGIALPNYDGQTLMSITPTSIYYSNETGSNSLMNAQGSLYLTQVTNGATLEESKSEVRPELLRLTRKEVTNNVATIGMTQIAAKSATFGGIVTVEGNLNVLGTITQGGEPVGQGGNPGADYLTAQQISATYLTTQAAGNTYALKTSIYGLLSAQQAALTYVTQTAADDLYALKADAEALLPRDEAAMTYLSQADAATTYALAAQVVTPGALATMLAGYHRNDQALVAVHPATFKSHVMVEGQQTADPDLPQQDPLESRKIVPSGGQLLVPEQGDISMGEFRAGALPVPAP